MGEYIVFCEQKKSGTDGDDLSMGKKSPFPTVSPAWELDPAAALATIRHEFGEHCGVNMSIETSAAFTVMEAESVSNPTLTVANIPELSRIAHDNGVTVVVENTFAPMVLWLARLGAEVVVHSITKFISSGADIIAGVLSNMHLCCCGAAGLIVWAITTSSELNAKEKYLAGISPGLIRISIGYIGTMEQKWSQFRKAISWMQDSVMLNK